MFNFTNKIVYTTSPIALYKELDVLLTPKGKKWLEWEPEVMLHMLPEVTEYVARNKILAIQASAANSDLSCSDHVGFESVGNCFCNYHYIVGESQPLGIEECFYTANQLRQIISMVHRIEMGKIPFWGEIPGYVASVAKFNNHRILPIPLNFGQEILDFLYPNTKDEEYLYEVHVATEINNSIIPTEVGDLRKLLDSVDPESTHGNFIYWIIGCYLYDPTYETN